MKRITISLSSLLILSIIFTLTSCNKEEASNGTQFRATMEDCTSQNGKTVLNGTALNWVEGDMLAIEGTSHGRYFATQTMGTSAVFSTYHDGYNWGDAGQAPYRAYYPYSMVNDDHNTISLPSNQSTIDGSLMGFPMYSESNNTNLSFKNLCGALKIHLTKSNTNISTITASFDGIVAGVYSINYNNGEPTLAYQHSGSNSITMTCSSTQDISNGKDFFISLPAGSYSHLQLTIMSDDSRICTKSLKENVTILVNRSQYTTITFGENDLSFSTPLPVGALNGLFSVSATQQVRFSKGNLQYTTTGTHSILAGGTQAGTFRFAEHQYDIIGSDNVNVSSTYTGWIDLFRCGTSGFNGTKPYSSGYDETMYRGGSIANTNYDWGVFNAISNGGNQPGQWRTLTKEEWDYLLDSRSNAHEKRGPAVVNGVNGIIILPDNWTIPGGVTFMSDAYGESLDGIEYWDWYDGGSWLNTYSDTQWSQMEQNGAVFIPCAGYRSTGRYGSSTYNDEPGYYQVATFPGNSYSLVSSPWPGGLYLTSYWVYPQDDGYSVRLVQNAE